MFAGGFAVCGIFGFAGKTDEQLLGRMGSVLIHRGPDDGGSLQLPWVSLGHRRLSIIDLAGGHQPLANEDETIWLIFNGEVYNYRELRAELQTKGHLFRTNSDSEVIIHAYEEFGPDCFARFNGMWALAIADTARRRLVLARDHFGIKPLYYAESPSGRLLFASEIKALLQDTELKASANDQMVYEYLVHGFHDHRPETFFEGIYHLMPATYMVVDVEADPSADGEAGPAGDAVSGAAGGATPWPRLRKEIVTFWTPKISEDGSADPEEFRKLFRKSVERRLVADVPVGSCLSGGLDSTAIVSFMSDLMKEEAPDATSLRGKLKTFSAVFDKDPIDERDYIKVAVDHTGADTTYIRPQSEVFVDELRDLIWHQEEPIVSTGPYAQWCVMREARKQVTVLLDGQGGDELLAGYVPYHFVYLRQLWKERKLAALASEAWAARDILRPFIARRLGLGSGLGLRSVLGSLLGRGRRPKDLPVRSLLRPEFAAAVKDPGYGRSQDNLKLRLLQDVTTYSLPCLLRYEDRNSMAHSIESRVPYLDQEMVEWILRLPPSAMVRGGWSRWIVRAGLRGVLPEKIRTRRWKVGFTTPEMRWLKARRATFVGLFRSPTFQARQYWDAEKVAESFLGACQGRVDESMFFWRAINVELWLREFVDARALELAEARADQAAEATGQMADSRQQAAAASAAATADAALTQPGPVGAQHRGALGDLGDVLVAGMVGTEEAWRLREAYHPDGGKHLFATARRRIWARLPIKTGKLMRGDSLDAFVTEYAGPVVRSGDIMVIAEKPVAISQGRSWPIEEIKTTWLARVLTKAVTKTPHGIGLGIPQTMQLALNEAGAPRILLAAVASAVGRILGVRGVFYKIAGPTVEAIDGPTAGTLPPYDSQAKLGPKDPMGVAAHLAEMLSASTDGIGSRSGTAPGNGAGGTNTVGVAIIDASDLSVKVLGHSAGVDPAVVATLMRDNPLGQGHQQTPIAVLRIVGELPAPGTALGGKPALAAD